MDEQSTLFGIPLFHSRSVRDTALPATALVKSQGIMVHCLPQVFCRRTRGGSTNQEHPATSVLTGKDVIIGRDQGFEVILGSSRD